MAEMGHQHSWKNAQTAQTRLCYFSGFLCYFCHWTCKYCFFAFCCQNWPLRWMSRHSVSWRVGQTCFLMVFYAIMRLILNDCFCAIFLRELSVCASFYAMWFFQLCAPRRSKSIAIASSIVRWNCEGWQNGLKVVIDFNFRRKLKTATMEE